MTLTITLSLMLLGKSWGTRLLAATTTVILAGVEVYTQSKGGWLALISAIVFIVVVGMPRLRRLMAIGGIALLALIGTAISDIIPSRFYAPLLIKIGVIGISFTSPTPENYANSERVAHWFAGIRMFLDHPFLGVGIGNYEPAYAPYAPGIFVIPLGHAHNYFINIAAEAGLFGLVAFVLFIIATFIVSGRTIRTLNQHYRQLENQLAKPALLRPAMSVSSLEVHTTFRRFRILVNDRALAVGLGAALLSVSVHNLVDNLYVHGMTILFALLIVLLLRLDKVA
jgi:O-antigen ligase